MKYRIMIETSSICNARCSFCSNPVLERPHMVMSDRVFQQIVTRIKEERIEVERFILHLNGEPFTDPKLIDRICLLKEEFEDVPVWFTTNFNLPDEKKIGELVDSDVDQVTISVNSMDATLYQELTGMNYERTLKNIECLVTMIQQKKSNLKVRLSIVDYGNDQEIKDFKDAYSGLFDVRIIKMGEWTTNQNRNGIHSKKDKRYVCRDLNEQICILSNGDYALCCFDSKGSVGLNVEDTPMLEAFLSEKYAELRHQISQKGIENTICSKCSFV